MDLMRISDLSTIFKDSKIIYHMTVPLIKSYIYTLYEISPLPKLLKVNTVSYIWPEFSIIAIDKKSNTYVLISESQLKDCKRTRKKLICTKIGLRNRIKKYSSCEVNIMMGKEMDKLQYCDLSCTQKVYRIDIINGTGVMILQPGCTVRITDIEIIGEQGR
jgi:hypothetical protein